MSLESRTRRVTRSAITRVLLVKDQSWAGEYRALCRRAGSFARTNGLMALLAMLESGKRNANPRALACGALLTHLREQWPLLYPDDPPRTPPADDAALLAAARGADARDYMFLTRRVLRLLMWHKRFAESLVPVRKDAAPSSTSTDNGGARSGKSAETVQGVRNDGSKPPIRARRNAIDPFLGESALGDNVGLAFDRYVLAFDQEAKERDRQLERFLTQCPSKLCRDVYRLALASYRALFEPAGAPLNQECATFELTTKTRLVIGLGLKGAFDFGLTFHPLFGTPLIPGSSLKGVAATYAAAVGGDDWQKNARQAADLFGGVYPAQSGEPMRELAGLVDFLDGWWVPSDDGRSPYETEIVNPHYRDYYAGKGRAPDGMEDPNPFKFLALRPGARFFFVIRGRDQDDRDTARRILEAALSNAGVGGKTRLGYGRFSPTRAATPAPKTSPDSVRRDPRPSADVLDR